jgi:predicted nucleotidyltransferase
LIQDRNNSKIDQELNQEQIKMMLNSEIQAPVCSVSIEKIKNLAGQIADQFSPEKIILFGSYANGNPSPQSDVDLLIIVNDHRPIWKLNIDIIQAIPHHFPLDIIVRNSQEIEKRLMLNDFFIEDILRHGIILYERNRQRMD